MNAKIFADTNLWIYAHLQKESDFRCKKAAELVKNLPLIISIMKYQTHPAYQDFSVELPL